MARDYGRISTVFWNSADVRGLSDQGKLLASYLLTGPHSNSIGAYLLPDAYIADDLGWSMSTVTKALKELVDHDFVRRFKDGRHIVVCKFLDWNPIENPNVGKAALKQLEQLPNDTALELVVNGLLPYKKQFPNGFETVCERFRNIEPNRTEPEIEPEPEPDLARSAGADEIGQAVDAYNSIAEELDWPKAVQITDKRISALRKRFTECGGIQGWRDAMTKARGSPYLRGETKRSKGFENWTPDFDFFIQQSSFTKLMEGKYDQRGSNQQPDGFDALTAGARRAAGLDGRPGQGMEASGYNGPRLAISGDR